MTTLPSCWISRNQENAPLEHKRFFDEMFAHVDALDARGFASFFTEAGVFRFGNNEPVAGRGRIEDFIAGFFSAIGGISHEFQNCWTLEDRAFANGRVTYVRKDGSIFTRRRSFLRKLERPSRRHAMSACPRKGPRMRKADQAPSLRLTPGLLGRSHHQGALPRLGAGRDFQATRAWV